MKRMTEISQSENRDQHAGIPTETKVQQSSIPRKNLLSKQKEKISKDRDLNKKIGTTSNDKKKQNLIQDVSPVLKNLIPSKSTSVKC